MAVSDTSRILRFGFEGPPGPTGPTGPTGSGGGGGQTASLASDSDELFTGNVAFIKASDTSKFTKATAATIKSPRGALVIARAPVNPDGDFERSLDVVPNSITGLGAGAAGYATCNGDGELVRQTSSTQPRLGLVFPDGSVQPFDQVEYGPFDPRDFGAVYDSAGVFDYEELVYDGTDNTAALEACIEAAATVGNPLAARITVSGPMRIAGTSKDSFPQKHLELNRPVIVDFDGNGLNQGAGAIYIDAKATIRFALHTNSSDGGLGGAASFNGVTIWCPSRDVKSVLNQPVGWSWMPPWAGGTMMTQGDWVFPSRNRNLAAEVLNSSGTTHASGPAGDAGVLADWLGSNRYCPSLTVANGGTLLPNIQNNRYYKNNGSSGTTPGTKAASGDSDLPYIREYWEQEPGAGGAGGVNGTVVEWPTTIGETVALLGGLVLTCEGYEPEPDWRQRYAIDRSVERQDSHDHYFGHVLRAPNRWDVIFVVTGPSYGAGAGTSASSIPGFYATAKPGDSNTDNELTVLCLASGGCDVIQPSTSYTTSSRNVRPQYRWDVEFECTTNGTTGTLTSGLEPAGFYTATIGGTVDWNGCIFTCRGTGEGIVKCGTVYFGMRSASAITVHAPIAVEDVLVFNSASYAIIGRAGASLQPIENINRCLFRNINAYGCGGGLRLEGGNGNAAVVDTLFYRGNTSYWPYHTESCYTDSSFLCTFANNLYSEACGGRNFQILGAANRGTIGPSVYQEGSRCMLNLVEGLGAVLGGGNTTNSQWKVRTSRFCSFADGVVNVTGTRARQDGGSPVTLALQDVDGGLFSFYSANEALGHRFLRDGNVYLFENGGNSYRSSFGITAFGHSAGSGLAYIPRGYMFGRDGAVLDSHYHFPGIDEEISAPGGLSVLIRGGARVVGDIVDRPDRAAPGAYAIDVVTIAGFSGPEWSTSDVVYDGPADGIAPATICTWPGGDGITRAFQGTTSGVTNSSATPPTEFETATVGQTGIAEVGTGTAIWKCVAHRKVQPAAKIYDPTKETIDQGEVDATGLGANTKLAQVDTTDDTPTSLGTAYAPADGEMFRIVREIMAKRTDDADGARFILEGCWIRDGGSLVAVQTATVLIGEPTDSTHRTAGAAAYLADFDISGTTVGTEVIGTDTHDVTWQLLDEKVTVL